MPHPSRLLASALAGTAAALLVAGCGGESGTPHPKSASPRPAPGGRPEITFPSYAKNVFEDTRTADPAVEAVLADSARSIDAVDEAIFKGSTSTKALAFYNTGEALTSSTEYVRAYVDDDDTWIGETRYFDRKAALSGADKAHVTYCSDESRSFIKNKKTNQIDKVPTTADSYVLYNATLAKNPKGVWQTTDVESARGHKACLP
ncbi:hypothetical protein [Streptomyces sp. NPDC086787]|uniref:hypothetical protein n=1 Tax=Streptomyces sp. NPDC086787 TaxID=3365759 RepID=UPI003808C813